MTGDQRAASQPRHSIPSRSPDFHQRVVEVNPVASGARPFVVLLRGRFGER